MKTLRIAAVAAAALAPALTYAGPTTADASAPAPASVSRGGGPPTAYTVTGKVVRFSNGRPVKGVRVTAYGAIPSEGPLGSDLTNAEGRYVIRGAVATDNEFHILVNGTRVDYERGWRGCDGTLKPTAGDACTFSTPIGVTRIKKD